MPTLKERIQSLTSRINEAKTSLADALRNKGVDPGSQPSFEAIRLGIERILSGDKYRKLIGKGSIFNTNLETNKTVRKMIMSSDRYTASLRANCNLDSIQSALDEINGSYYKGDLVIIITYTIPVEGNYGLCVYNLSEDLFAYFLGYGNPTGIPRGYPSVENALYLESVEITSINNTGGYEFSFFGYALRVGQSPVD